MICFDFSNAGVAGSVRLSPALAAAAASCSSAPSPSQTLMSELCPPQMWLDTFFSGLNFLSRLQTLSLLSIVAQDAVAISFRMTSSRIMVFLSMPTSPTDSNLQRIVKILDLEFPDETCTGRQATQPPLPSKRCMSLCACAERGALCASGAAHF